MNFRRAVPGDKGRILEICSTVWEGSDYMPNIIDKWLTDNEGEFTVMVEDGQVMGVGKMTLIGRSIGWLEGLRVAPEARSKGFAKQITRYYINKGYEMGLKQLQLSTYYDNHASIHVSASNGFQRVAQFWYGDQEVKSVKSTEVNSNLVMQATQTSEDYVQIVQTLLEAPEQKPVNNFLGYGWLFREISEELIAAEIAAGHVYYLKNGEKMTGGMIIYPDNQKDKMFYIPIITGTDEAIITLLAWAQKTAITRGFEMIGSMVPEDQRLKSLYMDQGFAHWENIVEPNVYVFQLVLDREDESNAT